MPLEELDVLQWGFSGSYGRVLCDAGLFAQRQRGLAADWYYVPTDQLWSLFAAKPELAELLPVLRDYVLAEAYERSGFSDCSMRRRHAETGLKRLGITQDGLITLWSLVASFAKAQAGAMVYSERSGWR